MIYAIPDPGDPLSQGDIIDRCPLVYWVWESDQHGSPVARSTMSDERVIVLTQSCDLANTKTSRVQVALVHEAQRLVHEGLLKSQTIHDQILRHCVYGWYFLPAGDGLPESLVDLRDVQTVPRELLEEQVRHGRRLTTLVTPYREHLAQHFAVTYSRIALPEPYGTQHE